MSLSEYVAWVAFAVFCGALVIIFVPRVFRALKITWEPWLFKKYTISPDVGTRLLGVALLLWVLSYVMGMFF